MAQKELDGLPGGGLNIAHEAVDRHANGARAEGIALRWRGRKGERRDITYAELRDETNRFANVLSGLDVEPGETVFLMMGRIPELYVAALGALKHRNVVSPLFAAFGPEPALQRMTIGDARVLVTTPSLYRRRILPIRERVPGLRHAILVGDDPEMPVGDSRSYTDVMASADSSFAIPFTSPEDTALLHFTSGTTGTPKGAVHVHRGGRRASHYRQVCARLPRGRCLLVHGRSGLGRPARRTASSPR